MRGDGMQIHQFKLHFNPEEDRIFFLMNTTEHQEFRFCLTRRFIRILWPVLERLLENDYRRRQPVHAGQAKEILPFEQKKWWPRPIFGAGTRKRPPVFPWARRRCY